jgi:hypothetical protein
MCFCLFKIQSNGKKKKILLSISKFNPLPPFIFQKKGGRQQSLITSALLDNGEGTLAPT